MIDDFQPDIVLGYGGSPLQQESFRIARRSGATTVFNLHNHSYGKLATFGHCDAVRVPSQFTANYYRAKLGLDCEVIDNPVDRDKVFAEDPARDFVTFVNPTIGKGLLVFARIAHELGRLRPDIPFLVVEARGTEEDVAACGLDLRERGNVFFMERTPDPRRFYRRSRIMLMPSLEPESFGRVAVEAMINHIPVLSSDRGALPETLGSAGILLELPADMKHTAGCLPSAREIEHWINAIVALWDNPAFYREHCRRAAEAAVRWLPGVIDSKHKDFLIRARAKSRGQAASDSR